jgi:hypothetical protein
MFKLERLKAPIYIMFITSTISIRSDSVELTTLSTESITLPPKYKEYAKVFSKEETAKFLDSTCVEHSILVEEGVEVPYDLIYSLNANKLQVLREYIKSSLAKRWIRPFKFSTNALILFILKKDRGLRLYVDYRGLNRVTI